MTQVLWRTTLDCLTLIYHTENATAKSEPEKGCAKSVWRTPRFSFMRSVFARATKRACNTRVRKRWPLQMGRPGEWRDFRSSKEPEEIQSCDPEAYNPKAVHIGPRHSLRCSPIFRQLKQHKCWRVNRLLQQSKHSLESMVQRLLLRLTPVINRNRFSRLFAGTVIGGIVLMLLFD
ncbi:hypothetical protein PVAP13_9NG737100 [Panicum virgatum]|uniref:Uncharacterized protein n=1 Tax=Panicum virgatum TaxID=38727 RepID=A0A8T0N349_PANVG|nr:hypothetical protein PVAP13_9NG737100 [Panicum virgatum]